MGRPPMADRNLIEGAEPFPRREEAPEWGYEEGEERAGRNFRRGWERVGGFQRRSGGEDRSPHHPPHPPSPSPAAAGSGEAPAGSGEGGRQVGQRRRGRPAAVARGRGAAEPRSSLTPRPVPPPVGGEGGGGGLAGPGSRRAVPGLPVTALPCASGVEWGLIFPDANGEYQSPINLNSREAKYDPSLLEVRLSPNYVVCRDCEVVNDGHSIQIALKSKSGRLKGGLCVARERLWCPKPGCTRAPRGRSGGCSRRRAVVLLQPGGSLALGFGRQGEEQALPRDLQLATPNWMVSRIASEPVQNFLLWRWCLVRWH